MTAMGKSSCFDQKVTRQSSLGFWTLVDTTLLFLTVMVSSDMLVHFGRGQSVAWLLCYMVALLRVIMVWPHYGAILLRHKVILAYPFACLITVLWSKAPSATVVAGVQLTMTFVIASYLGWRYSMSAIIRATFVVLSAAMVLSLLHWATSVFTWPVYSRTGGMIGVFSQKNMLGQRALFCAVIILAIWLMPYREAPRYMKTWAGVAMLLTLLALLLSQSMTSVLLLPALVGLLALICIRRIPPVMSTSVGAVALFTIALGPVVLAVAGVDPLGTVLASVGKDATLTGRTELWHVAQQVRAEFPLLGVGYAAFWAAPEFANERLMTQHAGAVTSASFHNFILEILVASGLPGAFAMFALLAAAAQRLMHLVLRTGSVAASCGLVLLSGMIMTSLLGPSLYRGHEFMIVLLVMFTVSAREDALRL